MTKTRETILTTIAVAAAFIGFSSTFLYASKSDISDQKIKIVELESKMKILEIQIERNQDDYQKDLKVLDENLRRLMIRRGVKPIPKENNNE